MGMHTVTLLEALLPDLLVFDPVIYGSPRSRYTSIGTPSMRQDLHDQHGKVHELTAKLRIRRCLSETEIAEMYSELRSQAVHLDPDALNDLGWMWMTGTHLVCNQTLAEHLLELAAAEGSVEAAFNLAARAYYGRGCPVNVPQAIERYTDIFKHGKVPALRAGAACALARIFATGEMDIEPDPEAAIDWYQCAINLGDKGAVVDQSKLRLDVYSPCQDVASAIYELQAAALAGVSEASYFLADLYGGNVPDMEYPNDPEGHMQRFWRKLGDDQEALAIPMDVFH